MTTQHRSKHIIHCQIYSVNKVLCFVSASVIIELKVEVLTAVMQFSC